MKKNRTIGMWLYKNGGGEAIAKKIINKLKERDIEITLSENAKELIAKAGFDPVFGARPLKRALYEIVEDRLADLILEGKVEDGAKVIFDMENENIVVNVKNRNN